MRLPDDPTTSAIHPESGLLLRQPRSSILKLTARFYDNTNSELSANESES
jgi:hypothetical protein